MQASKYVVPFYTKERWQNWINKVKESDFKLDDEEKGAIFVYMEDDVVLSCLKLITKHDKNLISKEETIKHLNDIKELVLEKIEPISEDIDIMLESMQLSFMAVFASCECYIGNTYEKTGSFKKLIKNALDSEKKDDMGSALDYVAQIGANILSGKKLKDKDLDSLPEGLVAEWIDGVESISAAMVGDTSYKNDEPDDGD